METELKPVPSDPGSRWAMPTASIEQVAVAPNQVLRNTYWLLALSMLPTIAGAYTGMAINFAAFYKASPVMAPMLQLAAGLRNGGQLVALAGAMTAAVFFVMATIATVSKRDFSFLGKFLFVGLILLVIAMLANAFLQVPALAVTLSAIAVLIFSAYLLYDVSDIVRGGESNYIMATIRLFLDILNLFVNLLNLLMIFSGQRD